MKYFSVPALVFFVFSVFAQTSTNLTGSYNGLSGTAAINLNSDGVVNASNLVAVGGKGEDIISNAVGTFPVNGAGGQGVLVNPDHVALFNGPGSGELIISSGNINGGIGGEVVGLAGNQVNAAGGAAVQVDNLTLSASTGTLIGGAGGSASGNQSELDASGGDGIITGFDVNINYLGDGLTIRGGNGGTTKSDLQGESSTANGGSGVNLFGFNVDLLNYPSIRDSSLTNNIMGGNYAGGKGGNASGQLGVKADGGHGFFSNFQIIEISDGTFQGGNGGVAVSSNSNSSSSAVGGNGFKSANNHHLKITGGDFYGGAGGTLNGVLDDDGAGVRAVDTDVLIAGGNFYGMGLFMQSETENTALNIEGGSFETISISSTEGFSSLVDITGGLITKLQVEGASTNTLDLSGGSISELSFMSSGTNALTVGGTLSLNRITQSSGVTDVNLWNDDHFTDTMVSGGVLNFNNQDFNLIDGAVMRLTSADAVVNFKGTNTAVKSGAQLDLGAGRATANALTVESGGSVRSTVYGSNGIVSVGSLEADQLTLDVGASWRLYNDGTFTDYESLLNSNAFLLGVSTNAITHGLTSSDVELIGEGMDAYWLYSINDLVVTNEGSLYKLYARYGMQNLGEALNAEGDFLTLMNLMQSEVDTNVDLQNALINYGSADAASSAITDGFLRTTEMGSTLVGAQSVLADQIGVRTREHLRSFRLAGKTGPSGARGPASWWDRSMNRLHDALPSFNLRDSMRSAQDRTSEPTVSDERPSVKKPWISGVQGGAIPSFTSEIVIPSHYQTWGRAYVADLDQESTDGFAGYDASVRGGVLGVDRRFDHAVVGVAGGMSKTIVTGGDGHSGEADSLQSTVYASYFTDRVYLNAHISFASSDVETDGVSMFGYRSEYDANSLSFFVGAGIGYKGFNDGLMITPEVSLLSSKYSRDGYTSSSSMSQTLGFEDMVFDSYDQWSYQSELGVAFSSIKLIENTRLQMAFQPEFRVHWVHEFEPNPDGERYEFVGSTQALHAQLQSREENLIRLGGGVRCWNWNSQTTEFGLNLDHLKGDAYTEWMFSGHFIHRF